jgi:hypothetical protein
MERRHSILHFCALVNCWLTRMVSNPVLLLISIFALELLLDRPLGLSTSQADIQSFDLHEKTPIDTSRISAWIGQSILPRPLFVSGRRMSHIIAPRELVHNSARLSGIIVAPNIKCAIFSIPGSSKPLVVTEGGVVGDTSVLIIEQSKVLLANGTMLTTRPALHADRQHADATQSDGSTRSHPVDTDVKAKSLRSAYNQFSHVR